jgi:DNA-binding GntR family transcriptional regulator
MTIRDFDRRVLAAIERCLEASGGIGPTSRELAPLVGVRSQATVKKAIDRLIAAGCLERRDRARGRCVWCAVRSKQSTCGTTCRNA